MKCQTLLVAITVSMLALSTGCKEAPEEQPELQEAEEGQEAPSPDEPEGTPENPGVAPNVPDNLIPAQGNEPADHVPADDPQQGQNPAQGTDSATDPPSGTPDPGTPNTNEQSAAAGDVLLTLGQVSQPATGLERRVGVLITTPADVAGFQFVVEGATLTGSGGGTAAQNGFSVSTSGQGGVVGISFSGTQIPVGGGVLTELIFVPEAGASELCLSGAVIADPQGESLPVRSGACAPL